MTRHEKIEAALRQIRRINDGLVFTRLADGEVWGYTGAPWFVDDDGWRYQVFNDCEEFDYFQRIESPAGWSLDYEEHDGALDWIAEEIELEHLSKWGVPS